MKTLLALLLVLSAVTSFAGVAAAQEVAPGDKVVFKKKTVIDLSGANIDGELTRPEGTYIVNRKLSRFSSLITLRENYIPELLASPDNL